MAKTFPRTTETLYGLISLRDRARELMREGFTATYVTDSSSGIELWIGIEMSKVSDTEDKAITLRLAEPYMRMTPNLQKDLHRMLLDVDYALIYNEQQS